MTVALVGLLYYIFIFHLFFLRLIVYLGSVWHRGVKWVLPARHGTGMTRKNSARVRFRHGISWARHGMAWSERARGTEMVDHGTGTAR